MDNERNTSEERNFRDEAGTGWTAFAADAIVAHGRPGAVLAFRAAEGGSGESFHSTVTFNSTPAANFALRTMSEKDLRRRLSLARVAAGSV
ncbi:MAG: hypothetical protein GEU90_13885 [Gemmatimonas sp.]|nr:hypothetical protein [Gemmatimonas sp.]